MLTSLDEFPKLVEKLRGEWADPALSSEERWAIYLKARRELLSVCKIVSELSFLLCFGHDF